MEGFRRRRVSSDQFVGYRFSRTRETSVAGLSVGFVLREGLLPTPVEPPEAVAYVFARPVPSPLHRELLAPTGALRHLIDVSHREGFPFELHTDGEVLAVRHRSLRRVPPEIFPLIASDFFLLSYRPVRAADFPERLREATTGPGG